MTSAETRNLNRASIAAHPNDLMALCMFCIVSRTLESTALSRLLLAGNALWQSTLISIVPGVVFALIFMLAVRKIKTDEAIDWFGVCRRESGRLGSAVSALALCFLFGGSAFHSLDTALTIASAEFLPLTPTWIVALFMLGICAAAATRHLQGVVRTARIWFIFCTILVYCVLFIDIPSYQYNYLHPLWGNGIDKTLTAGLGLSEAYTDMLLIALILPVRGGMPGVSKAMLRAVPVAAFITTSITLSYILLYPAGMEAPILTPLLQVTVVAELGRFLQRITTLMTFVWCSTMCFCISSMIYGMSKSWVAILDVPDEQPFVWIFALILFLLVLLPEGLMTPFFRGPPHQTLRTAVFLVALLPPLVGSVVHALRRKKAAHAA